MTAGVAPVGIERSRTGSVGQRRSRLQGGKRPHNAVIANRGQRRRRLFNLRLTTYRAAVKADVGTQLTAAAYGGRTLQDRSGEDRDVGTKPDRHIEIRAVGINHRHPRRKPMPVDSPTQFDLGLSQLDPVIHRDQVGRMVDEHRLAGVTGTGQHLDDIRQPNPTVDAFSRRSTEGWSQQPSTHTKHTERHLLDVIGIIVVHQARVVDINRGHPAMAIADDPVSNRPAWDRPE